MPRLSLTRCFCRFPFLDLMLNVNAVTVALSSLLTHHSFIFYTRFPGIPRRLHVCTIDFSQVLDGSLMLQQRTTPFCVLYLLGSVAVSHSLSLCLSGHIYYNKVIHKDWIRLLHRGIKGRLPSDAKLLESSFAASLKDR